MNHLSDSYHNEYADHEISDRAYNGIIGGALFWGFCINIILVAFINPYTLASINPWIFLIGYAASCFLGISIVHKSDDAIVKFIGYNFIVVPFGLVLNIFVSQFEPDLVLVALFITGVVTLSMMTLGTLFPAVFVKMGRVLLLSLILAIVIELVMLVVGIRLGIIDWIVAIIFCGYIGYDWAKANQRPKTAGNAIESATAIYMDIINLFIRILRILGKKR